MFLHPRGELEHPVSLRIQVPPEWKQISTGLERVQNLPGALMAPDFNVLYDCPILIGNQERLEFEVRGVPHYVAIENVPPSVDRAKMAADLKRIVSTATTLMDDIPYRHYTFLMMGRGAGGIEHANSSSNQFDGASLNTPAGYLRWLSFISHEYFHNFNVKRIRPLALGPFDYGQENLTHLLWVSEGLSVYYQDLVLVRAGLMTPDEYLAKLAAAIGTFENASGRRYQSATESSWNTWNAGSGVGGDRSTTISYYNNGAMIGAMLDLAIRQGSGNRKSLDDVMRSLYRTYYQQKNRGFTSAEFRSECERAAGGGLSDVFEYASTTREVDYQRYFAMAGLKLDVASEEVAGGFIGLDTQTEEIPPAEAERVSGRGGRAGRGSPPPVRLVVIDFVPGSPAAESGLRRGDRILNINETAATPAALNSAIAGKPVGDAVTLQVRQAEGEHEVQVKVAHNTKKTYRLYGDPATTPRQSAIYKSWLGGN
jgi:predicted metalloprotease with PDZ domain